MITVSLGCRPEECLRDNFGLPSGMQIDTGTARVRLCKGERWWESLYADSPTRQARRYRDADHLFSIARREMGQ